MPRKKSGLFDQSKYVQQYMKDNIKQVKVSLNKNKPDDMQMIAWIAQQQEGASGYIKRLIREDMEYGTGLMDEENLEPPLYDHEP